MHLKLRTTILLFLIGIFSANAFSLLGPYAEWMQPVIGYRVANDIGGPMNAGEEYRWNVPVITYGFDEAFLTTFGQSGVDAVEEAIQHFNDLPPASEIDLQNFSTSTTVENFQASSLLLLDLKTATMSLLIEQLGLANPQRFVYALRTLERTPEVTNFSVIVRNFDPEVHVPTNSINGVLYTNDGLYQSGTNEIFFPRIIQMTPESNPWTAAAWGYSASLCLTNFTRDDVGGLRYLYSPDNRNLESLLPDVFGIGTNSSNFVGTALRPGVNKITFIRQPLAVGGDFVPYTNDFVDHFITGDEVRQQTLRRITSTPDIVFSARDFGVKAFTGTTQSGGTGLALRQYGWAAPYERSDTSVWVNNSEEGGIGPGIIIPGIKITFRDMWKYYIAAGHRTHTQVQQIGSEILDVDGLYNWASFDNGTNVIVHHGAQTNLSHLTLETRITETNSFCWAILANYEAVYDIQRSTNLTEWQTLQTFTNEFGLHVFVDTNRVPNAFYRAVKIQDAPTKK